MSSVSSSSKLQDIFALLHAQNFYAAYDLLVKEQTYHYLLDMLFDHTDFEYELEDLNALKDIDDSFAKSLYHLIRGEYKECIEYGEQFYINPFHAMYNMVLFLLWGEIPEFGEEFVYVARICVTNCLNYLKKHGTPIERIKTAIKDILDDSIPEDCDFSFSIAKYDDILNSLEYIETALLINLVDKLLDLKTECSSISVCTINMGHENGSKKFGIDDFSDFAYTMEEEEEIMLRDSDIIFMQEFASFGAASKVAKDFKQYGFISTIQRQNKPSPDFYITMVKGVCEDNTGCVFSNTIIPKLYGIHLANVHSYPILEYKDEIEKLANQIKSNLTSTWIVGGDFNVEINDPKLEPLKNILDYVDKKYNTSVIDHIFWSKNLKMNKYEHTFFYPHNKANHYAIKCELASMDSIIKNQLERFLVTQCEITGATGPLSCIKLQGKDYNDKTCILVREDLKQSYENNDWYIDLAKGVVVVKKGINLQFAWLKNCKLQTRTIKRLKKFDSGGSSKVKGNQDKEMDSLVTRVENISL